MISRWAADALAALLDRDPPGESLPPMWQLGQLLDAPAQAVLGPDGHPRTGVPSPPGPGLRRMFAGGRLTVTGPLRIGVPATRRASLAGRVDKAGRGGPLTFLTVRYEFAQDGATVLVEEQDLAYTANPVGPPPPAGEPVPAGPGEREVTVDPTLLFRFSALTYNAHRIHYDRAFTAAEGYPGLLVHGPLQALLMADHAGVDGPCRYAYRLTAPLYEGQGLVVGGGPEALYVRDGTGRRTAEAAFTPV